MADDTATEFGVVDATAPADIETDTPDENAERPKSPRELAMEAMHADRVALLQAEIGSDFGQVDTQIRDEPQDPAEAPAPLPVTTKVKIDGEEQEVTQDELIRSFQKNAAADRRLEEASRIAREAKELLASAQLQVTQQTTEASPQPAATDDDAAFDKFVSTLYEGDTQAAKAAYKELQQKSASKGRDAAIPSRAEIVEEVKQQLEVDSALAGFRKEFPDIWKDPHLSKIADERLDAELASGKHATFNDAMIAAGNGTRDWMKSVGMGGPLERDTPTVDLNTRLERKAGITNLRTASTRNAPEPAPEASDQRSAIAEMRKARGQT